MMTYGEGPPSPYIEAAIMSVTYDGGTRYGEGPPSPYIEASTRRRAR